MQVAELARELRPQIEALPRLTRLVVRYLALLAKDSSPIEVARGIEADPTLTRMVFAACTRDLLRAPMHRYPCGGLEFWRHSVICGTLARALARQAGPSCGLVPDEALLAGLLHDLGKRPLDPLLERRGGPRPVSRQEEIRTAGVDHATISAAICQSWELPAAVVTAVAAHHASDPAPSGALLGLADALAYRRRDRELPPGTGAAWRAALDLSESDLTRLLTSLDPVLGGLDEMLRLLGHAHVPPDRVPPAPARPTRR